MARTKNETRDRAAQELGILPIGQTLAHSHSVRVLEGYDEVYADLKNEGIATWAATGSVPDELVPHVVFLIADNCLGTYGVSDSRYQRIKMGAANAKREIRRLVTPHHETMTEPTDY